VNNKLHTLDIDNICLGRAREARFCEDARLLIRMLSNRILVVRDCLVDSKTLAGCGSISDSQLVSSTATLYHYCFDTFR